MIRKLLATTALATLVASGAYAQTDSAEPTEAAPAPQTDGATINDGDAGTGADATAQDDAADTGADVTVQDDADAQVDDTAVIDGNAGDVAMTDAGLVEGHLASNLIGTRVYNGTNDDAENIGSVKDIVIGNDGKAELVVIGVGGFLGMGEKDVALEYASLEWAERDGDMWLVASGQSREQLETQAEFDRAAYDPTETSRETAATDPSTMPADTGMDQPADTSAAVAPADQQDDADVAVIAPSGDADSDVAEDTATVDQTDGATNMAASDEETSADTTDRTTTGAIDRSQLQPWDTSSISADELIGTTVYGADDERIGEIGDVVLSQNDGIDAIIVDVGGFLGIGEKSVAIGMEDLEFMRGESNDGHLYTSFTQEQLEAQPEYDEATYADSREEQRLTVQ